MLTEPNPDQSLKEYLNQIESTDVRSYLDLRGRAVESDEAHKIKSRILDFYKGIEAAHHFRDENGQIFDCIPWNQYPTHKAIGQEKIAPPPPIEPGISTTDDDETHPRQLSSDKKDRYRRAMYCETGTVAMLRFSLSQFAQRDAESKRDYRYFIKKSPDNGHRYAHASQLVRYHRGLGSTLSVWAPEVDRLKSDQKHITPAQIFSLSQIWCCAGRDDDNSLQTVEVGWHVMSKDMAEGLYQSWDNVYLYYPHLFVYFTPDNYGKKNQGKFTDGSYAGSYLELVVHERKGFVLTTNKQLYVPGMALWPVSKPGAPKEIKVQWMLDRGGWWLGIGEDWVGYYPVSLFGDGGALASKADVIDFGGETCCDFGPPEPTFPQMGSGSKPTGNFNADSQRVAYQKELFYYRSDGKLEYVGLNLKTASNEPGYGIHKSAGQTCSLFFGGPGGQLAALRKYEDAPADDASK